MKPLNLFYEEPDPDRWLPFDRFPRRALRTLLRNAPQPGGQARVFLNLRAGLDAIGAPYRVNDYGYARAHPEELACIVGKPFVLDKIPWRNPIMFGAATYSHPCQDPTLLERRPIRRLLVPGEWMRRMCEPDWGDKVLAWPVGIDTALWRPASDDRDVDVLLYDKVRWEHDRYEVELLEPIRQRLRAAGLKVQEIRYGAYREEDFHAALGRCRAMIFVCEHETQGIAYQQALSCGVPLFAWDRGGYWQDPYFFPDKVRFEPVTSVPYWDDRCGERFADAASFAVGWEGFWSRVAQNGFAPRDFVVENLTLEACARRYVELAREVGG